LGRIPRSLSGGSRVIRVGGGGGPYTFCEDVKNDFKMKKMKNIKNIIATSSLGNLLFQQRLTHASPEAETCANG
jgi:hypothetical protein